MHSRIFQYSDSPVEKDNYIGEDDIPAERFAGKFYGDYTTASTEEERIEDIKWLEESLKKFSCIERTGEDKFTLKKGYKEELAHYWLDRIQDTCASITLDNISNYTQRFNMQYALSDPLCHGFGFLFYNPDGDGLSASDDFFEWLLNKKEGDSFYIGGTLDYHC